MAYGDSGAKNVTGHMALPAVNVTAVQPEIADCALPFGVSKNATVPVGTPEPGLAALTVAVNVVLCPLTTVPVPLSAVLVDDLVTVSFPRPVEVP